MESDSNKSSSSNNCGKVCLFSCLGCIGLIVLFALIILLVTCAGCTSCMGGLGNMFGGLWNAYGQVSEIQGYFEDLKAEGWEVDDSQANQQSGYGSNVETDVPMIWRARESEDDDWTEYVWVLSMPNAEELENMDGEDFDFSDLGGLMEMVLLPRTEAAVEVHEELGFDLPDDFELEPWTGRDRDRDRDDEDRVRDRRDRDRDDEEEEDSGRTRRSKTFKLAA